MARRILLVSIAVLTISICVGQAIPPIRRPGGDSGSSSSSNSSESPTTTHRPAEPPQPAPPGINPFNNKPIDNQPAGPPPIEVANVPEDADFAGLNVYVLDGISEDQCNKIKALRKNDTAHLLVTKYRELVSCIYAEAHKRYMDAAKNSPQSLDPDDFVNNPPLLLNSSATRSGDIIVDISDIFVTDVDVNQAYFGASVVMSLKWTDKRLRFSPHTWAITSFELPWEKRIWTPKLVRELEIVGLSYSLPKLAVPFSCAQTVVYADGTVECETEKMTLSGGESTCEFNMRNYPDDDVKCCVSFLVAEFEDLIKLNLKSPNGLLHKNYMPRDWKMAYIRAAVNNATVDHRGQELKICTAAHRDQTSRRTQLALPMAIAAVVGLLSFLIPQLALQLTVKVFALLLQFLCFKSLVERTMEKTNSERGSGNSNLHVFYEFTVAVTIFSLLVTMLCQLLYNASERFPGPPGWAHGLATRVTGAGFFCLEPAADHHGKTLTAWQTVALGVNRLFCAVLVPVFILGAIIISAQ